MDKITNKLTKERKKELLNQMILDHKNRFFIYNYIYLVKFIFEIPAPINKVLDLKLKNFNWSRWEKKKDSPKVNIQYIIFDISEGLMKDLKRLYKQERKNEEYIFDIPFKFRKQKKNFPNEEEEQLRKRYYLRILKFIQNKVNHSSQKLWGKNTNLSELRI